MRVGVIGLGKLGLIWALRCRQAGHQVVGYDINLDAVKARMAQPDNVSGERGMRLLADSYGHQLEYAQPEQIATWAEIVYVCVQTPHEPEYGGEQPMPPAPRDFDYRHLEQALLRLAHGTADRQELLTVAVMSTVLPGTFARILKPAVASNPLIRLIYAPAFISLGSIVADFAQPRLGLFGADNRDDAEPARQLQMSIAWAPRLTFDLETAELAKMAINCWQSLSIVYANALAEVCEAVDADVDGVVEALRVFRPRPADAGLGDGGACRPRDAIAMRWLLAEHGLDGSTNPFRFLTEAREEHAEALAHRLLQISDQTRLPVFILGLAYKPGVPYTFGSPALLLAFELSHPPAWDPYVHRGSGGVVDEMLQDRLPDRPALFVIGTNHREFATLPLPEGSIVVDPWGSRRPQDGVTLIKPGRQ